MTRVAVVVSHPIQYFCPQYSSWAMLPGLDLFVLFASDQDLKPYEDRGFGRKIHWEGLKLDFPHRFLPGAEAKSVDRKIDSTELEAQLKAFEPDLLIVYGYWQRLQRRARKWANRSEVSCAMISDAELRTRRSRMKRVVKWIVLPRLFRRVSFFLTVGDANEAYYRNYGVSDDRFVRCFFPIDREHYDSVIAKRRVVRSRVRASLGIPDSHKVILNVGKLVPGKRQQDLVRFSNEIQGRRDDTTVILAGSGLDDNRLRALCQHHGPGGVIFAGFVPPEVLAEHYCAADVYVQCSDHDRHSLAISEAIYCGLPVVISDRCGSYGPTDDVRHGLNGLVYECSNTNDLAHHLLYVLNNDQVYKRMETASKRISRCNQALAHGEALEHCISVIEAEKSQQNFRPTRIVER